MTVPGGTVYGADGVSGPVRAMAGSVAAWLRRVWVGRPRPAREVLAEQEGYAVCVHARHGGGAEVPYPAGMAEADRAWFKEGWDRALADKATW